MTYLPDVNVWLALLLDTHVHGPAARQFADEHADDTFVLCRVTQMAVLRLLTNPRVTGPATALTPAQAWAAVNRLRNVDNVVFAAEPDNLDSTWQALCQRATGSSGSFWTDSHLAAFAISSGATLVTFDKAFRAWPKLKSVILNQL